MKLRIFTGLAAFAMLSVWAIPGFAQNASPSETAFVRNMARSDATAIAIGKLAQQKAESQSVKDFANKMVADHTKLNDDLKRWAAQNHVELPSAPSAEGTAEKQRLERLSGAAFDKAYIESTLLDQQKNAKDVRQMAERAKNPQVKSIAQEALAMLDNHVHTAEINAEQLRINTKPAHAGEASRSKRK